MQRHDPLPRGRIRRTMPLAGFTARAAGGRVVAGLRERTGDAGAVERFHQRTAERYTELLGHSKGVLMKAGQMMSLIDSEAFGTGAFAPYQKALSRLHRDAPPMDAALAREVLATGLGDAVEHFAEFDDEPMAAASIGQVHRAILRDGREVVVKIQYPGVAQAIRDDLANSELLATFMRFVSSATRVGPDARVLAREAAARISEEIDYRHEARALTWFGELFEGHPLVRIPEVIPYASGERVLTMTMMPGMDWAQARHADQDLKNAWCELIARFVHGSFRHGNVLHADPHPGNYRFNADGTVGFLDFGCVKVIPERMRKAWVAMNRAALDGRWEDCRVQMRRVGFLDDRTDVSTEELRDWWRVLLLELTEAPQPVTYTTESTSRLMSSLFSNDGGSTVNRLMVPEDFAMFPRVQLALNHIAVGMGATLFVRSLMDELDGVGEPVTEVGELHCDWVRRRGLPAGLEHRDHP